MLGLLGVWVRGLGWGVGLLAACFLVRLQLEPAAATPWTPVAAAALLLMAELGYWSYEMDDSWDPASTDVVRRLLELLVVALAGGAVCELALDLAAAAPLSGGWLLILGVLAATAPLAILLRLARRSTR